MQISHGYYTHQSKLKKLYKQQKHASRIIFNKDITTHSRPLLKSLNALNVYQLNIFQTILLMYKCNNNSYQFSIESNSPLLIINILQDSLHIILEFQKENPKQPTFQFPFGDRISGIII